MWPVALLLEILGEAVSPSGCAACDARLTRRTVFCPSCAITIVTGPRSSELRAADAPPLEVWSFGAFGGALATAIRRLKYGSRPDLARPLGELLRRLLRDERVRADVVAPVPLHPSRLAMRGYNQSALLAARAAPEASGRFACLLERVRQGPTQVGLDRMDRAAAVRGAFRAARRIEGKRVLVIDDVVTTGATLSECASALRSAGASWVGAAVLARTDSLGP